jgi:hypothetical protein
VDDGGVVVGDDRGVLVGDDGGVVLGNGRGMVGKVDFCGVVWWRKKNPKKIQRVC